MKYFKDANDQIFAYELDGSQDHYIGNKLPITKDEADVIIAIRQQAEFDELDYYRKRIYSYPEPGQFLDAWVKQDEAALEEYRQLCLEIKAKYPKPTGF
jgi:hypothetical protein